MVFVNGQDTGPFQNVCAQFGRRAGNAGVESRGLALPSRVEKLAPRISLAEPWPLLGYVGRVKKSDLQSVRFRLMGVFPSFASCLSLWAR